MDKLELTQKQMEMVLRMYLFRIDTRPLYWYYEDNGQGKKIKVKHGGEMITITFGDLLEWLFPKEEFIFQQDELLVLLEKGE